jgi:hypothetical protein
MHAPDTYNIAEISKRGKIKEIKPKPTLFQAPGIVSAQMINAKPSDTKISKHECSNRDSTH